VALCGLFVGVGVLRVSICVCIESYLQTTTTKTASSRFRFWFNWLSGLLLKRLNLRTVDHDMLAKTAKHVKTSKTESSKAEDFRNAGSSNRLTLIFFY